MRRLRRLLGGRRTSRAHPLRSQRRAFERAHTLVAAFYACHLFAVFLALGSWRSLARPHQLDPLWPVAWVPAVGVPLAAHAIMAVLLLGALCAAWLPRRWPARLAAFAGFFLYVALENSFGKINHSSHAWLLAAFALVFLPDGERSAFERSRARRQRYLNGFWSAQALVLLTYSMAGAWKLCGALVQLGRGEMHSLAPLALAYHIADRLLRTQSESVLGGFVLDHPLLDWPQMLCVLYLQTTALLAAFRPPLQRLWGLGLIGFHIMVYLTLAIPFQLPVLLLGLLLLCSPFAPERASPWECARALPLLGPALARLAGSFGALAPAAREAPESAAHP